MQNQKTGEISSFRSQRSRDLKRDSVTELNTRGSVRRGKTITFEILHSTFCVDRERITRETLAWTSKEGAKPASSKKSLSSSWDSWTEKNGKNVSEKEKECHVVNNGEIGAKRGWEVKIWQQGKSAHSGLRDHETWNPPGSYSSMPEEPRWEEKR